MRPLHGCSCRCTVPALWLLQTPQRTPPGGPPSWQGRGALPARCGASPVWAGLKRAAGCRRSRHRLQAMHSSIWHYSEYRKNGLSDVYVSDVCNPMGMKHADEYTTP